MNDKAFARLSVVIVLLGLAAIFYITLLGGTT